VTADAVPELSREVPTPPQRMLPFVCAVSDSSTHASRKTGVDHPALKLRVAGEERPHVQILHAVAAVEQVARRSLGETNTEQAAAVRHPDGGVRRSLSRSARSISSSRSRLVSVSFLFEYFSISSLADSSPGSVVQHVHFAAMRKNRHAVIDSLLNDLTLKRLYWLLAAVAAVAVVLWAASDATSVETWMPNIASELIGALVTVALVDFILRRQRRPLRDNAARRIDSALYSLFQVVMNQRTRTQKSIEETSDPKKMLSQWQSEIQGQLPERDWLKYWAANLASVEGSRDSCRTATNAF